MDIHPVDIIFEEMSDDGWWKQSTRETFISCYSKLKKQGMNESEIIEILSDLYCAVSGEFRA